MTDYSYPRTNYDDADSMLAMLGSFWNSVYAGNEVVRSLLAGQSLEMAQAYLQLLEAAAAVSRFTVPVFHTDNWYLLELKQSEINSRTLSFGDDAVFGAQPDGTVYNFGQQLSTFGYQFPLPVDLVSVPFIFNRITAPSISWQDNLDYYLHDGYIAFRENPFNNALIPQRLVYQDGELTDVTVALWVYRGEWDWQYVYRHFGYLLSLQLASSTGYRDFVNAILDALAQGSAAHHIVFALSALTGIPIVREASETVELVQTDNNHLVIVTDQHAYRFPTDSTATVSVGDSVVAGDTLTTDLQVCELNTAQITTGFLADLAGLALDVGWLAPGYVGGLTFVNRDTPLVVTEAGGVTKVEFEIGGFPTDVTAFWDEVHARGLAGTTLARLLDVRGTDAVTEPTAASLPATVNPMQFLVENLLRFHTFVVQIRTRATNQGLVLSNARLLRKVIPPWTAALFVYTVQPAPITLELTAAEGEEPGYAESLQTFSATELQNNDLEADTRLESKLRLFLLEGVCQ